MSVDDLKLSDYLSCRLLYKIFLVTDGEQRRANMTAVANMLKWHLEVNTRLHAIMGHGRWNGLARYLTRHHGVFDPWRRNIILARRSRHDEMITLQRRDKIRLLRACAHLLIQLVYV